MGEIASEITVDLAQPMEETKGPARGLLVVVFEHKGMRYAVEFPTSELGFEYAQGGGCCGPVAGKALVKVKKVTSNAAALGVVRGAIIRQVNGKDIADADQLRDLIASASDVPASEDVTTVV